MPTVGHLARPPEPRSLQSLAHVLDMDRHGNELGKIPQLLTYLLRSVAALGIDLQHPCDLCHCTTATSELHTDPIWAQAHHRCPLWSTLLSFYPGAAQMAAEMPIRVTEAEQMEVAFLRFATWLHYPTSATHRTRVQSRQVPWLFHGIPTSLPVTRQRSGTKLQC